MRYTTLATCLLLLASCKSEIEKRDEQLQQSATRFVDSMLRRDKSSLTRLDSLKIVYVDTLTESKYYALLYDDAKDEHEHLKSMHDSYTEIVKSDLTLMKLATSHARYNEYRADFDEYMEKMKANLEKMTTNNDAMEVFANKIEKADSVQFYGFLVRAACFISNKGESSADTPMLFVDKGYKAGFVD